MRNCSLVGNNDFYADLDLLIASLVKNSDNPKDHYSAESIKQKFCNGILDLQDKYPASKEEIDEAVQDYFNGFFNNYVYLVGIGHNYLQGLSSFKYRESLEQENYHEVRESKTDSLTNENRGFLKNLILLQYFLRNSSSKLFFEKNFKNKLVKSLFINDDILIDFTQEEQLNDSILAMKASYIEDIKNYLKILEGDSVSTFFEILLKENFLEALEYAKEYINPSENTIAQIPLINIEGKNISANTIAELNAYQAYIALKHFDQLIANTLNKSITIKNPGEYDYSENKYSINLGDRNSTTWRDEDKDVDETEELSSLPTLFIEILPLWKNGVQTSATLNIQEVKNAIGKIMNLLNYNNNKQTVFYINGIEQILLEEFKEKMGEKTLKYLLDTFVKGKTVEQVWAQAKQHSCLMPIAFRLLLPFSIRNADGSSSNVYAYDTNIYKATFKANKDVVLSLYYNIYAGKSNGNSLFSMTPFNNPDASSIYNFMNGLFINIENKPHLEYLQSIEEGTSMVSLSDKASNDRLNLFMSLLLARYHKHNPLTFDSFTLDNKDLSNKSISLKIKGTNEYTIKVNDPTTSNNIVITDKSGNIVNITTENIEQFIPFLSEVFLVPITTDILNNYNTLREGKISEIIQLAGNILYHYLVGKQLLNTTKATYKENVSKYYEGSVESQLVNILPRLAIGRDWISMTNLSQAIDITEGYTEINTVKDGARKPLASLALSSLLPKVGEIWRTHTQSENSPAKNFSMYELYQGFELMRDFSGLSTLKEAKKFNVAELASAAILLDYYGDLLYIDNGKEKPTSARDTGGVLRIGGPIVADKTNLIKLKFGWDTPFPKKYWDNPEKALTLRNITSDKLKSIIKIELGEYYSKVYDNIISQWNKVNTKVLIACKNLGIEKVVTFDYNSNFQKANEAYGKNILEVLHEAIRLLQEDGEDIEIIEGMSYIAKGNSITNNPSLLHLMSLFDVLPKNKSFKSDLEFIESYEDFWKRKEFQLVSDFLRNNTHLKIKDNTELFPGIAYKIAEERNKNFLKRGSIAPIKIFYEGKERVIESIYDLKEWFAYSLMMNELTNNDDKILLDIDSPDFNLEYTLNTIAQKSRYWGIDRDHIWDLIGNQLSENITAEELYKDFRKLSNPEMSEEEINLSWENYSKDKTLEQLDNYVKKYVYRNYLDSYKKGTNTDNDLNDILLAEKIKGESVESFLEALQILENASEEQKNINNLNKSLEWEINPELIHVNLLNFYLDETFTLSTTGTYIAHPGKGQTISEYEASLFGQAVKRYVSYTASKHRENQNLLNGIPEELNIAIIEDDKDLVYNMFGLEGSVKSFDGASFYSGTLNYLSNNSLGADAMGTDKKSFAHSLGTASGIGFILKNAGFSHTNDRIRNSVMDALLNKKMYDMKWDSTKVQKLINPEWKLGDPIKVIDWTKDFNEKTIDYGEWYVFSDGKWVKRAVRNGVPMEIEVRDNGEIENQEWKKYSLPINSNYDLWNFFGGAYSGHLNKNKVLTFEGNNDSFKRLTKALNNQGFKKFEDELPIDLTTVNQVLKKAQIHLIATKGAVKYGGANINSAKAYFDDSSLTYMNIPAYDIGEQLDSEHSSEDGNVALMTLVINALGARGYTSRMASECYEALEIIARSQNSKGLEALALLELNPSEREVGKLMLKDALAEIIYKAVQKASATDGDMFNALASTLLSINSKAFTWEDLQGKFPLSHPAIFSKVISSIASLLEKSIRLKFEGGLFVLNPSNKRFTIIEGRLSGYYNNHPEELEKLEEFNKNNPIFSLSDIKLGFNYRDSNGKLIKVQSPADILDLEEKFKEENFYVYETVKDDEEKPLGHDLACYQVKFYDSQGHPYSSWQIDSIRRLFHLTKVNGKMGFLIPDINKSDFQITLLRNWDKLDNNEKLHNAKVFPEYIAQLKKDQQLELLQIEATELWEDVEKELRAEALLSLNALSSEGVESTVKINGENILVDKTKTIVTPYEMVLPKMYATEFGLKVGDDLSTIQSDSKFFLKRALENSASKLDKDFDAYDIELKTLNGNHVYLGYKEPDWATLFNTGLQKVDLNPGQQTMFDGETLFRINDVGEKMYPIPYIKNDNGLITIDCTIYKTFDGTEIIYSNNLVHFLDNFHYNKLLFKHSSKELLSQVASSSNPTAINKIKFLTKATNRYFNTRKTESSIDKLLKSLEGLSWSDELLDLLESNELTFEEMLSDETYVESLIKFTSNDIEVFENKKTDLEKDIDEYSTTELKLKYPFFMGMISSSEEVHTSFLQSLEGIVSRTPAQSLLSFMAMKVAAFGPENTNSAYVSRYQIWYQGSDYTLK